MRTVPRIIDASAKKLDIAPQKVVLTVDMHGNTSAASIPLALGVAIKDGRIKKNDLVMLEAMGCGAPILAMPTGGTSSAIRDGVDGALEPTPALFARRMAALLGQPAQRRALGTAARQTARARYAQDVVVGQIEALYESLRRTD